MNNPCSTAAQRILVVDDNAAIHADFRKILCAETLSRASLEEAESRLFGDDASSGEEANFAVDSALQGKEGFEMVKQALAEGRPYALAFVDVRMPPGWDGIETISHIWKVYPELQVVICTAYSDYSWDQIVRQLGRSDSLVILKKPFDNVEVLQLAHALTKKWFLGQQARQRMDELDRLVGERTSELEQSNEKLQKEIAQRQLVEEALRVSEERFSKAFHSSPIALAIHTAREPRFVDVNQSFVAMTGATREELMLSRVNDLKLSCGAAAYAQVLERVHALGSQRNQQCAFYPKTGEKRDLLVSLELFDLGTEPHVLVIAEDITERLNLEDQLRQLQKMEAVGQLAAGVAHDFNNILTIIQGHVSLLLVSSTLGRQVTESLRQVSNAADRAAALTRQLLAFSRKQFMQPRTIDLQDLIEHLGKMLTRLIGEHIALTCEFGEGPLHVQADPACLEQVLVNLAVNARDAMPHGGQLKIATARVTLGSQSVLDNPEARAGEFIRISVIDTGSGIAPEILPRIFEPFFTTKDVGKGTGLGLATVYGILKQHDGWIEVASHPGQGSAFNFFLPAKAKPVGRQAAPSPSVTVPGAQETVLVVEDEPPVRKLICEALTEYGYRVLSATNGVEALEVWERRSGKIDMLLTDMVMPGGVSGRRLAETMLSHNPQLKVIYSSGYVSEAPTPTELDKPGIRFLPKPYSISQLTRIVSDCFHGNGHSLAHGLEAASA
jgi:two-component system, cell cycle sensor histidine kinase and response regulator CckA